MRSIIQVLLQNEFPSDSVRIRVYLSVQNPRTNYVVLFKNSPRIRFENETFQYQDYISNQYNYVILENLLICGICNICTIQIQQILIKNYHNVKIRNFIYAKLYDCGVENKSLQFGDRIEINDFGDSQLIQFYVEADLLSDLKSYYGRVSVYGGEDFKVWKLDKVVHYELWEANSGDQFAISDYIEYKGLERESYKFQLDVYNTKDQKIGCAASYRLSQKVTELEDCGLQGKSIQFDTTVKYNEFDEQQQLPFQLTGSATTSINISYSKIRVYGGTTKYQIFLKETYSENEMTLQLGDQFQLNGSAIFEGLGSGRYQVGIWVFDDRSQLAGCANFYVNKDSSKKVE